MQRHLFFLLFFSIFFHFFYFKKNRRKPIGPKVLKFVCENDHFSKKCIFVDFFAFFLQILVKVALFGCIFLPQRCKKNNNILVFFWNSGTQNIQIAPLALGSAVGVATHCYLPVFHGGAPQQFLKILKKHTKIEGLDACKKIKHCKKNKIPPAKK